MNVKTTAGLTASLPVAGTKPPRLQFALGFAALTVAALLVAFGTQTLTGITDGNRSDLTELKGSVGGLKVQVSELEKTNGLSSVGNSERRALILELDAELNSTEGFIQ